MLLLQISLLLAAYSTNVQIAYVLLMLVACSNPPFISNKENLNPLSAATKIICIKLPMCCNGENFCKGVHTYVLWYISAPPVLNIFACSAHCFIINVKTWEQNESMHAEQ